MQILQNYLQSKTAACVILAKMEELAMEHLKITITLVFAHLGSEERIVRSVR